MVIKTNCIVKISIKLSITIVKFMIPESGVQAIRWGECGHDVTMYKSYKILPTLIYIGEKTKCMEMIACSSFSKL